MIEVKEMEFNNYGKLVALNGTFIKNKKINSFSPITKKVYFWATLSLDYCGG